MRRWPRLLFVPLCALAASLIYFTSSAQEQSSKPDFDMTASYIEACSCDMFCPCYFNTHSTNHMGEQHMDEHYCRANLGCLCLLRHSAHSSHSRVNHNVLGD